MTQRKKLIEVALPLEAINKASAREKSIRHGHPSTLHLWWARRPLAACRAVIFASLVDDPDDPDALPQFVEACRGEGATSTDFDYAGPLTEAILLGCVASHFPQTTLEWDAQRLRFGLSEANAFVRREYRNGWAVKGLS